MSRSTISRREWAIVAIATVSIIAATVFPYRQAYLAAPDGLRFGGFLLNPLDGNSYLAKMEQGRRGAWSFRLPYSADPGAAEPIFLFYIFLGHIAAWTGLRTLVVFHVARVLAGCTLLLSSYRFAAAFFVRPGPRLAAWALIAVGSGLGWLAIALGVQTADLWVAEAIVFLSILENPHFPLAAALALDLYSLLAPGLAPATLDWKGAVGIGLGASLLAHVQPFTLVTVCAVLAATYLCYASGLTRPASQPADIPTPPDRHSLRFTFYVLRSYLPHLAVFAATSLPWLLLDVWLTRTHPVLRIWSAQNQTPSPPPWDYLIAFSPAVLLALAGAWHAVRRRSSLDIFLLAWLVTNALLLYAPLSIQRRFSHGLSIPIALLAVQGVFYAVAPRPGRRRAMTLAGLLALTLPGNLLVLLATLAGASDRSRLLFLRAEETRSFDWIDAHTPAGALVLASPETGLFIPAYTARRVLYGHPYETIQAAAELEAVTAFYANPPPADRALSFLHARGVNYVVYGPRESDLGAGPDPVAIGLRPVYQDNGLTIFEVPP